MKAIAVGGDDVLALINFVMPMGSHVPSYGELSSAIAQASTEDPLFPERDDGCLLTAILLIAIAFCGSGFHTSLVGNNGKAYGVYQIQHVPPDVSLNKLLTPRDASYIAISLIRESLLVNRDRPWQERLAYFFRQSDNGRALQQSMERMNVVEKLRQNRPASWIAKLPQGSPR
jgi:hypothetical protein